MENLAVKSFQVGKRKSLIGVFLTFRSHPFHAIQGVRSSIIHPQM
jgi:hypothetical protein